MNYEMYIARRVSAGSDGHRSSPAVRVAVAAVALSVAVMLAAIAIVLGFKREIRSKVLGFNPHITLYVTPLQEGDDNIVTMTEGLRQVLDSQPYITSYSLEASIPAILKTPEEFKGVYMRGLEAEGVRRFLASNMVEGNLPARGDSAANDIVLSRIAADALGLKAGDKIDTYFISGDVRVRRLTVRGIFNSHFDSYDNIYIYGSLPLIQQLGGVSATQGTSLLIDTDDFGRVEENSVALQNALVEALASGRVYKYYHVDNALNQGASYFNWLALLDTNVVVILVLMMVVSLATLISAMLIIILEKRRLISVLRALGVSTRRMRRIFVYISMRVALVGMLTGNAVMISLLAVQDHLHLLPLDAEAYYIDFVPVEISWPIFLLLNVIVLIVVWLSLWLPSRFVAGIDPAESLAEV